MNLTLTQAYTYKSHILIQVIPPPYAYIKSANARIHYAKSFCYLLMHTLMHFVRELPLDTQCVYLVYAFRPDCNKDAYMHEQTTKGFGKMNICISRFDICIGRRKYPDEYTPFGSVSLCLRGI